MNVKHNEEDSRFECDVEGGTAICEYHRNGDRITFTHTEVPPQASGQGVASKLVGTALDYARKEKLQVVPECHYVAAYVKRHTEYADIVDPEYR